MDLEAAASYLVALAVPLWLAGEYVVHVWKAPAPWKTRASPASKTRVGIGSSLPGHP